jgi:hypothetical protein
MLLSIRVYIPLLFMHNTGMLHAHHRYVTVLCNMHNSTMYHRRYSPVMCTRPLCYTNLLAEVRIPPTAHAFTSAHPALSLAPGSPLPGSHLPAASSSCLLSYPRQWPNLRASSPPVRLSASACPCVPSAPETPHSASLISSPARPALS